MLAAESASSTTNPHSPESESVKSANCSRSAALSHGDNMSWYTGFVDSRGIGIYDSQPVPGTPASHGCVRVGNSPADDAFAKKINQGVVPGKTIVEVSEKAATEPWLKAVKAAKKKKLQYRHQLCR